ncbi:carbohydrate kinase family protein [Glycomyces tarimensis]
MITVVGEALLDLVSDDEPRDFAARPGGSPANVAVGLARLDDRVTLATCLGDDLPGRLVGDHLRDSGVTVERLPAATAATSLALASIAEDGSADYSFHLAWDPTAVPELDPDCRCVHTGSLATALEPGAAVVEGALERARRRGVTVSYDPNIRPILLGDREVERRRVERQVSGSDIVKASAEDVDWLYPGEDPHAVARKWVSTGPALVVLTRDSDGACALTASTEAAVTARPVTVRDTVGAGDAFTAGLLDALLRADLLGAVRRERLAGVGSAELAELIGFAALVAAKTCERTGANPPTRAELEA